MRYGYRDHKMVISDNVTMLLTLLTHFYQGEIKTVVYNYHTFYVNIYLSLIRVLKSVCLCVCVVCQEKQLDTEEGSLECKQIANLKKSSAIAFSFTRVFHFLMIFLLFALASVVGNHKAATEADVLNKIAGILKYAPDKIGAGGRGKTGDNDK